MKKFLLAGVAALLMATSAHAGMCHEWQCGQLRVGACVVKHLHQNPDGTWGDQTYDQQVNILREGLPGYRFRLRNFNFKFDPSDWTASLNGKACKEPPEEP
jgi:hypothetical protein